MQTAPVTEKPRAKRIRVVLRFVPAIVWMGVIYFLSDQTGEELNTFLPWMQKLFPMMSDFNWGHFAAYFILALSFDYGFGSNSDRLPVKLVIVMLCLLYGVTDEYHQSFVGGRTPDWHDLRNDTIGAALAVLTTSLPWVRKLRTKLGG
ncbi:hypothetical protein FHS18_006543 [Paenibacillus phyllosphaerae]|uniref:VanZ-like domain-containing protein n=1 Tax=Paenibacillus phyllosphaerae TaxID=274593 RepID=A0A7W5B538_9BACL|nr:VanZ family protein [Paenibacillus phyllosphaerae]MBB3114422.1 hypothetical protein [Paenibacillus phyllosphaerae]